MDRKRTILTIFILLILTPPAFAAEPAGAVIEVENGTIYASCAPWDGAAFIIELNSHVKATVYASLDSIEKSGAAITFQARNDASQENDAIITKCDEYGNTCKQPKGSIAITTILGNRVTGAIQFPSGHWGRGVGAIENHMFRVKYDRTRQAECG
jgi:hypothetical protein